MTDEWIVKTEGWMGMTGVIKKRTNDKKKEEIEMNGGWTKKMGVRNEK